MKQGGLENRIHFGSWLICGLGAIYYCYEYFLRIMPSVITPELMRLYHLTGAEIGNLSAFYYHAYMPMQIFVGLLVDRFGPRRLLTVACLFCALGTYLFASGYSLGIAQLGRFLVGWGSAFAFVGALKLATIWLPANRFALVSGMITCLGMVGAMAGDIILRSVIDTFGWQVTLYFSALFGVLLAFILWSIVRDQNPNHPDLHLFTITFKELLYGLWGAIKNNQVWLSGLIGFLLYLSLSAFAELWGISYLEQARGLTSTNAATANSMIFLGWAIGAPFWGWFSDYIERRRAPLLFSSLSAVIVISALLYLSKLSLPHIYILLFLFGFFTSVEILVFAICREVTSFKIAATAIALTNMLVMIGGNFFQPIMGLLLDMQWTGTMIAGARIYSPSAFVFAMSVLPIGIVIAMMLTFFIRETHAQHITH